MFEAARWDDEIVHTSALTGFLIGAAIGLAMVAFAAIAQDGDDAFAGA